MTTKQAENTHVQQVIEMGNAAVEAAKGLWQQLLDAQLAGFEQAMAQLEQLSQRGLTRAQGNVDEALKLTRSAVTWLTEAQAEVTKAALHAVRSAAAQTQKAAAA